MHRLVQSPLFSYDPEIERTLRNLRAAGRRAQEAIEEEAMDPQQQQMPPLSPIIAIANDDNMTIQDWVVPLARGLQPSIIAPPVDVTHFELKLVLFSMLQTIGQFSGSPTENLNRHIIDFL